MKCAAFVDALYDYPANAVEKFSAWQRKSFGRSRYMLFEDFFDRFLGRAPEEGEMETLLDRFADACRAGYEHAPLTDGALRFLDRATATLFVVSGSDQAELRNVFQKRGLDRYFEEILGSPIAKSDNLKNLIERRKDLDFMVFFGDASADFEAARQAGVPFHYISAYAAAPEDMTALRARYEFTASATLADAEDWHIAARNVSP